MTVETKPLAEVTRRAIEVLSQELRFRPRAALHQSTPDPPRWLLENRGLLSCCLSAWLRFRPLGASMRKVVP